MIKLIYTLATLVVVTLATTSNNLIDYISMPYNIYKGNPLASHLDPGFGLIPIFNLTSSENQDSVNIMPSVGCNLESTSQIVNDMSNYSSYLSIFASAKADFPIGSFSASAGYHTLEDQLTSTNNVYTAASGHCTAYEAELNLYNLPTLTEQFINDAITSLSGNFDEAAYFSFLDFYGTHFIQQLSLGSRINMITSLSQQDYENLYEQGINVEAAAQASFSPVSVSGGMDSQTSQNTAYNDASTLFSETTIGSVPPLNGGLATWANEVLNNPMPIAYSLASISDLFTSSNFDAEIIPSTEIQQIQNQMVQALEGYCEHLQDQGLISSCQQPPPPPSPQINSCRFCDQGCGGEYPELQGSLNKDPNWLSGLDYFASSCTGDYILSHWAPEVYLCCMPEIPLETVGSCKLCQSCGSQFSYPAGSVAMSETPQSLLSYGEACAGDLLSNYFTYESSVELCCDQPPMCTFCSNSCGGDYPFENGGMIAESGAMAPGFYSTLGNGCSGSLGPMSGGVVRFCCKND